VTNPSVHFDLLQAYGTHFDGRDAASFAALFTEDAVVVTPLGKSIIGREKIAQMVERTPAGGQHEIGIPVLLNDGGDVVTSRTDYSARMADGTTLTGSYENTFRFTDAGWLIAEHTILPDT